MSHRLAAQADFFMTKWKDPRYCVCLSCYKSDFHPLKLSYFFPTASSTWKDLFSKLTPEEDSQTKALFITSTNPNVPLFLI
jgi:hypothetical protein